MKKEWQLTTGASVSLYPASEKYVIYFHGGGFVYGTRQDIPASLIALFQEQQYSVPHSRLFTGAQFLVSGDFGAELAKFSRIASNCA